MKFILLFCLTLTVATAHAADDSIFAVDPFANKRATPEQAADMKRIAAELGARADAFNRTNIETAARVRYGTDTSKVKIEIELQTAAYERILKLKSETIPGIDPGKLKQMIEAAETLGGHDWLWQMSALAQAVKRTAGVELKLGL